MPPGARALLALRLLLRPQLLRHPQVRPPLKSLQALLRRPSLRLQMLLQRLQAQLPMPPSQLPARQLRPQAPMLKLWRRRMSLFLLYVTAVAILSLTIGTAACDAWPRPPRGRPPPAPHCLPPPTTTSHHLPPPSRLLGVQVLAASSFAPGAAAGNLQSQTVVTCNLASMPHMRIYITRTHSTSQTQAFT